MQSWKKISILFYAVTVQGNPCGLFRGHDLPCHMNDMCGGEDLQSVHLCEHSVNATNFQAESDARACIAATKQCASARCIPAGGGDAQDARTMQRGMAALSTSQLVARKRGRPLLIESVQHNLPQIANAGARRNTWLNGRNHP